MEFGLEIFWPAFRSFIIIMIYLAVAILLIKAKTLYKKMILGFIAGGYFLILFYTLGSFENYIYNPQWDFYTIQIVLMFYLSILGLKLLIDKKLAILLTIIFVIGMQTQSFIGIFISFIIYILISVNFAIFTIKQLINFLKYGVKKLEE